MVFSYLDYIFNDYQIGKQQKLSKYDVNMTFQNT